MVEEVRGRVGDDEQGEVLGADEGFAGGVGELAAGQWAWDDADHLDAGGESGIGQRAHAPDRAAAVDEPEPAPRQLGREVTRRGHVLGAAVGRRAAEHAHPPHGVAGVSQASANSSLRAPV